jgi:uncharacterized membrane protein YccF (DUF307 family)
VKGFLIMNKIWWILAGFREFFTAVGWWMIPLFGLLFFVGTVAGHSAKETQYCFDRQMVKVHYYGNGHKCVKIEALVNING